MPHIRSIATIAFSVVFVISSALAQSSRTGFPPFTPQAGGPWDSVNLVNLNVHLRFPITARKGRGPAFSFAVNYDGSVYVHGGLGGGFWFLNFGWDTSGGVTLPIGGVVASSSQQITCSGGGTGTQNTYNGYIDALQTLHPFAANIVTSTCDGSGGTTTTKDGSGYTITISPNSASVTARDGTVLGMPFAGPTPSSPDTITDSNGNQITFDGTTITDTLGTTPLTASGTNSFPNPFSYSFPNSQGGNSTISFSYANPAPAIQTAFQCGNEMEESIPAGQEPLIDSITYPDGSKYHFTYEPTPGNSSAVTGRLGSVTVPTGGTISYSYTGSHDGINCLDGTTMNLTRTTPDGIWTYSRTVGSDGVTTLSTTVTDPQGNQTVVNFQNGYEVNRQVFQGSASLGFLLETVLTCYNSTSAPSSTCSPAPNLPFTRVTTVTEVENTNQTVTSTSAVDTFYNANGVPTETDEYDFATGLNPGPLLRKTLISYASLGSIVDHPAQVTVQDGSGNVQSQTTVSYDEGSVTSTTGTPQHIAVSGSRGNPTTISSLVLGTSTLSRTTSYFDTGLAKTTTDPKGNVISYSYGNCGNSFLTSISKPLSISESHAWSCTGGVITSTTDENNQTTSYVYGDANFWRVTQINYPDGGQITTTYNTTTVPWSTTQNTKISSSQTLTGKEIYDGLGRISQQQLTSDPAGTTFVDTTYDKNGRLASVSNPHRSSSSPTDGTVQYTYDALGRMTKQTQQDGVNSIQWQYDLNCVTVTDEAGKQRETCSDGLGRIQAVFEPDNTNGLNWETDYTYQVANNLATTTVSQKGGSSDSSQWRTRSLSYDGLDRLVQSVDPESGTTSYAYTTNTGSLCSGDPQAECRCTDARGIIKTFAYDALNRLIGETYSDNTPAVTYSYDQSSFNGLTITNGKGRRTGMSDTSGQTAWSYDPMGRDLVREQKIAGTTKSIGVSYNLDGSIASITYPSGRVYTYTYDNAGHPTSLVDSAHGINFVGNTQWAPPGLLTSAVLGAVPGWNAITETDSYNTRLQPTQFKATSPVPLTLLNLSFSYDQGSGVNNGNMVQVANNRDTTRSVAYTYDQLNRLASAKTYQASTWGDSYTYDPWGNLLTKTVTQGSAENLSTVVNGSNHVTTPAFTYDSAGNVTWDTVNAMKYDAEGRMNPVSGLSYTYDGDGRRVEKSDGTVYWLDDASRPLSVGTTSGSISQDFLYFNGQRIAFVSIASGNPYYFLSDNLNSTAVIASGDGKTIQWEADYFPFGSVRHVFTNLASNHYQFTGDEFDFETGYNYAVARYEAGSWGRFLRPDPYAGSMDLSNPQSLNRYAYVLNDPVNAIDPLGLDENPGNPSDGYGLCSGDCSNTFFVLSGAFAAPPQLNVSVDVYCWDCWMYTIKPEWLLPGTMLGMSGDFTVTSMLNSLAQSLSNLGLGAKGFTLGVRAPGQSYRNCMEANASAYSLAGAADLATNGMISKNGAVNFVANVAGGNSITGTYFAFAGTTQGAAFNAITTGVGSTGSIIAGGMGSTITFGRRTADIMSLNLAGKGGLPLALSPASSGIKGFLGKIGGGALKLAADVGLTLAEGVGCTMTR